MSRKDYLLFFNDEEAEHLKALVERDYRQWAGNGLAMAVAALQSGEARLSHRVRSKIRSMRSMQEQRQVWVYVEDVEDWIDLIERGQISEVLSDLTHLRDPSSHDSTLVSSMHEQHSDGSGSPEGGQLDSELSQAGQEPGPSPATS